MNVVLSSHRVLYLYSSTEAFVNFLPSHQRHAPNYTPKSQRYLFPLFLSLNCKQGLVR